jgi:3-hydroxyacyl-[acyl-carrier-protein] dehydratase
VKLNSEQIESLIPHRRPFLFVKSATIVSTSEIEGVAQWDAGNPILEGHFPGFPVVPGVLIVEAAAQIAGLLISFNGSKRSSDDDAASGSHLGMLIGVKRASFHKPVFAGDLLTFNVKLANPIGGMISTAIEASGVDDKKVFKGEISVAVVDRLHLSVLRPGTAA